MSNTTENIESVLKAIEKAEHFIGIAKVKLNGLCRDVKKSESNTLAHPLGISDKQKAKIASRLRQKVS
jgi:hypothetical protein